MNAGDFRFVSSPTPQNHPDLGHTTTTVPLAPIHRPSTTDSGTSAWRQQHQQRGDQDDLNKGECSANGFRGDLLECIFMCLVWLKWFPNTTTA